MSVLDEGALGLWLGRVKTSGEGWWGLREVLPPLSCTLRNGRAVTSTFCVFYCN